MAEEPKVLQSLLVEKTGESAEDIRQNLQELKEKIEAATEAGESFTIEGFGTFFGETGSLHFEPSSQLEIEINQKYAGMQPVELVEAFKETGAGIPLEPVGQKPSQRKEPEHLSESVVDDSTGIETDKEEPRDAPLKEKEEQSVAVESDEADQGKDQINLDVNKKHYRPGRRKKNGNSGWIVAAAIFIIVILVVGWLFFTHRLFPGKENSQIITSQPVDSSKVGDLPVNSASAQGLQSSPINKAAHKKAAFTDSSSATYGLHGEVNHQLGKAYTIVVHSFQLKSTVQEIAKNLSQEGYRAVIFSGKSGEEAHWRVGLGQFKTIEAAKKAVKELPERYQKAHFIHRINY